MDCRAWLAVAVAALAVAGGGAQMHKYICDENCRRKDAPCPSPCRECPPPAPCPAPTCPRPKCPPPPPSPRCPPPICPTLPELAPCPKPIVNLTCPPAVCNRKCDTCPTCPERTTCPAGGATSTPAPPATLPPGYEPFDAGTRRPGGPGPLGSAYRLYESSMTWMEANRTCASDGAYLAIPNSEEELNRLLGMMESYEIKYLHIGFHDTVHENEFLTVLGAPMDGVQRSFWADGEPNGGTAHNCVYLHREKRRIFDEPCTDRESFACEISHI